MEDWVPITSAVAATCLGLILIIVLLILCLKWRRRHKWNPLREPPTPEWTPVKSLKYTSLVTDLTKSVPQTLDIGHFRDYPSFDLGESGLKSNVHNLAPRKHKIQPLPLNLYDDDSSHCPRISDSHKTLSKFSSSNTSFLQQLQDKSWKDSSSSSLVTQPVIDDDDDDCYQVVVDDDESTSPDRDSSFEHVPLSDYCDPVTSPTTPEFLPQTWSTPDYHPTIEFCVIYLSSTNVLGVHVKRIINLPPKYQSISIKFKLLSHATGASPQSPTSIYNLKTPKKVFDSENGASVTFPLTSRSELKHYDLYILVFKKRYNRIREKLLGEVIYSMAQIEFCSEIPVTCLEKLTVCSKKRSLDSSKDKSTNSDVGQLMVSLFYQTTANRMKVLVRRASNLPKKKKVLGQSEYYVVVNAISYGQVVASQETKAVHGRYPVWNHPMIFNVPEKNLETYSFQFVVMTTKMSSHSASVGHIVIGPNVKGSGHDHWIEAVNPRSTESAKWHYLQPI